jgi:biotin operon repressor
MKTVITKDLLETLLEQGLSGNQIGKQLGYSGTGIRFYMKK